MKMETASFPGGMARARLLAGLAVVAVGLAASLVAPTTASARDGIIVVQAKITLNFPAPGVYEGKVDNGNSKIKRNAMRGRRQAGARAREDALDRGFGICLERKSEKLVKVLHLSKPPFLIGTDKPNRARRYSVSGPEPPTGDPVKAFQLGSSGVVRTREGLRFEPITFRWRVKCKGAQVTKPYPF